MKVTSLQIPVDKRLYERLMLICERLKHKKDVLILVDGAEGDGKSTIAAGIARVFAEELGRTLKMENVFFEIDEMIKFATTTEKKIIWWDEAALGGLRREWASKYQIKLLKLLMIARKKQHVFIFNIPRIKRLAEDIIDRATCLIHVYSPDEITVGRYAYYRKNSLRALYEKWQSTKKVFYQHHYDFIGPFYNYIERHQVIDPVLYDAKKDAAILKLGTEEKKPESKLLSKLKDQVKFFKKQIGTLPLTAKEVSKHFNASQNTVYGWKRIDVPEGDFSPDHN